MVHRLLPLLLLSAALAACGADFDPYNELKTFRVLALRAERPYLRPGQRTGLDALTYQLDPGPVTWDWSWCPLTTGGDRGYECAVGQPELQRLVDMAVGPGVVTVPPYELSSTASAAFAYALPPAFFQGICAALSMADVPNFVPLPDCMESFPLNVILEAQAGGQRIRSVKTVRLVYAADAPINANPVVQGLSLRPEDSAGALVPTSSVTPARVTRDTTYELRLDLPAESSETYLEPGEGGAAPTQRAENLVVTWFIEGGETEFTRTTFIAGEIPLERAQTNTWTAPRLPDFPRDRLRLLAVVRDGRSGVGWIERELALEVAP